MLTTASLTSVLCFSLFVFNGTNYVQREQEVNHLVHSEHELIIVDAFGSVLLILWQNYAIHFYCTCIRYAFTTGWLAQHKSIHYTSNPFSRIKSSLIPCCCLSLSASAVLMSQRVTKIASPISSSTQYCFRLYLSGNVAKGICRTNWIEKVHIILP